MDFNVAGAYDSFKDGTKEIAELTHEKTNELHKNYVSKVLPDCGKYGDKARFIAEMVPGVTEYNAIRDGNWEDFAIAAGLDVASLGIGAVTGGAGYAAIKGSGATAKAGTKLAVKEVAEAGTKKAVGETAEKIAKKTAETRVGTIAKETIEKVVKEVGEKIDRKALSQIERNRIAGKRREGKVFKKLISEFGEENVLREQYIRDSLGNIIKDPVTGEARRIDFIVIKGKKVIKSIEVTSEDALKGRQILKECRIREEAKKGGGAFIRDFNTGKMFKISENIDTEIRRLK